MSGSTCIRGSFETELGKAAAECGWRENDKNIVLLRFLGRLARDMPQGELASQFRAFLDEQAAVEIDGGTRRAGIVADDDLDDDDEDDDLDDDDDDDDFDDDFDDDDFDELDDDELDDDDDDDDDDDFEVDE